MWLIKQEIGRKGRALPFHEGPLQTLASSVTTGEAFFRSRVTFPSLTIEVVRRYTNAYFSTFNVLYPILNYSTFTTDTLEPVMSAGFGYGDSESVLTLLVLAAGELAAAAITDGCVPGQSEMVDGVQASTTQTPQGLQLFNEARARLGSISFRCDLASVQIQLLIATYFEASGYHLEFWSATVSASMACHVVALSPGVGWHTLEGDAIKRAYWSCVINEDMYHLDLDLVY